LLGDFRVFGLSFGMEIVKKFFDFLIESKIIIVLYI